MRKKTTSPLIGKKMVHKKTDELEQKHAFQATYVPDAERLLSEIKAKKNIPYQVEIQPAPKSKKICWMECPYCYGGAADDSQKDRMDEKTALSVCDEIIKGGVKKIIFAGYATDPLNSPYIESLLEKCVKNQIVFGFNTKGLKMSREFIELATRPDIAAGSYISLSVDAGTPETYNQFHGLSPKVKVFEKVIENAKSLSIQNANNAHRLNCSAAYLVNELNYDQRNIYTFLDIFEELNFDIVRFAPLQKPRNLDVGDVILPEPVRIRKIFSTLDVLVANRDPKSERTRVIILNPETQLNIGAAARTLPCFSRWVFPTVGFDGYLYHCSQSSAPDFRSFCLGKLSGTNFWDLYYNYDAENLADCVNESGEKMTAAGCRCDRKMHMTNGVVQKALLGSEI